MSLYENYFEYEKYINFNFNTIINNNDNNISIAMCTWKRFNNLENTLELLNSQTIKNIHLYIWNNNFEKAELLYDILTKKIYKNLNISWHNSPENIGGIGRFLIVKKLINDNIYINKIIFIDDDQYFGLNAIEILICNFKPLTSYNWYGKIFKNKSYWNGILNMNLKNYIINNKIKYLDYGGTGFMIIDTNCFTHPDIFKFNKKYLFIEDLWLSYFIINKLNYKILNGIDLSNKVFIKKDKHELHKSLYDLKIEFLELLKSEGKWIL